MFAKENDRSDIVHYDKMELDNKLKGEVTNALKYCETLMQNDNLITNTPPDEISSSSIAMGEEFYKNIVEMLGERQIVKEHDLITCDEIDHLQEYTEVSCVFMSIFII